MTQNYRSNDTPMHQLRLHTLSDASLENATLNDAMTFGFGYNGGWINVNSQLHCWIFLSKFKCRFVFLCWIINFWICLTCLSQREFDSLFIMQHSITHLLILFTTHRIECCFATLSDALLP